MRDILEHIESILLCSKMKQNNNMHKSHSLIVLFDSLWDCMHNHNIIITHTQISTSQQQNQFTSFEKEKNTQKHVIVFKHGWRDAMDTEIESALTTIQFKYNIFRSEIVGISVAGPIISL